MRSARGKSIESGSSFKERLKLIEYDLGIFFLYMGAITASSPADGQDLGLELARQPLSQCQLQSSKPS